MKKKFLCGAIVMCLGAIVLFSKPADAATKYVAINKTNFPDAVVRGDVKDFYDANNDGKLSEKERSKVTKFCTDASNENPIKDLKGIELFPNIKTVDIKFVENLVGSQLSKCKKLKKLMIEPCGNSVDLSMLNIEEIEINDENLTPLNNEKLLQSGQVKLPVSIKKLKYTLKKTEVFNLNQLTNLTDLDLYGRTVSKIDVSKNNKVKTLSVVVNKINNFNLNDFPNLENLNFLSVSDTALDFTKNPKLKALTLDSTDKVVNLSKNKKLAYLCLMSSDIFEEVILPANKLSAQKLEAKFFNCHNFTKCNFNDAKNLAYLSTDTTNITTVDLSKVHGLRGFASMSDFNFTKLILPKNSSKAKSLKLYFEYDNQLQCNYNDARNITNLHIANSNMTKLDISKLSKLSGKNGLYCRFCNKLKEIHMPQISTKAKELYCDIRGNKNLVKCNVNDSKNIKGLYVQHNNLKSLNASKLSKLKFVYCGQNKNLKKIYLPKGKKVTIHKDKWTVIH